MAFFKLRQFKYLKIREIKRENLHTESGIFRALRRTLASRQAKCFSINNRKVWLTYCFGLKPEAVFIMQNFTTKTIREIAVANPATVPVFEEYKIDFCCGGGRAFNDACRFAGVAPEIVSEKINQVLSNQIEVLKHLRT